MSFLVGGRDAGNNDRDEILAWAADTEDWVEVARMKEGRSYHAMTTIAMREVSAYCG